MAESHAWQLEDYADNLDISEEADVVQIRDHWVFARHRIIPATWLFTSTLGDTTASIDYYVGNAWKHKLTVGGPKYICVAWGISPQAPGSAGEFVLEREVWEMYSAWRDAPTGWGL